MKEKFIRVQATDDIEMCGLLFEPTKTTKRAVVHVHGLAGNFFENRFVSYLAEMFTAKGYSYVTFNNRGYGYVSDLLKGDCKTVKGGASYELFEECQYDIEGILQYLTSLGYEEFLLEGHSYGCNKVVYSYHFLKEKYKITKLILLSPCDVLQELRFIIKDYDQFLEENIRLCEEKREKAFISNGFMPVSFSAKTVVNNFASGVVGDIFRYRDHSYQNPFLQEITIPVYVVIGEKDECVFTAKKEVIESFFDRNLKCVDISYLPNSKHIFKGQEEELRKVLEELL